MSERMVIMIANPRCIITKILKRKIIINEDANVCSEKLNMVSRLLTFLFAHYRKNTKYKATL